MDFTTLIRTRYSVRAYKTDPVPEEALSQVLEAARIAPTASNRQPFKLIVIPTAGKEEALRRIYNREWFPRAPLIICACGIPGAAWESKEGVNYVYVDVAIAMDHLILAATELGLGTCWVGAFDRAAVKEIMDLPEEMLPIAFTPLGYPADQPSQKVRKPLEALVQYWEW